MKNGKNGNVTQIGIRKLLKGEPLLDDEQIAVENAFMNNTSWTRKTQNILKHWGTKVTAGASALGTAILEKLDLIDLF